MSWNLTVVLKNWTIGFSTHRRADELSPYGTEYMERCCCYFIRRSHSIQEPNCLVRQQRPKTQAFLFLSGCRYIPVLRVGTLTSVLMPRFRGPSPRVGTVKFLPINVAGYYPNQESSKLSPDSTNIFPIREKSRIRENFRENILVFKVPSTDGVFSSSDCSKWILTIVYCAVLYSTVPLGRR